MRNVPEASKWYDFKSSGKKERNARTNEEFYKRAY